jgi:hypothetical protein
MSTASAGQRAGNLIALFWALLIYAAFTLIKIAAFAPVCVMLNAEGLRLLIPGLAFKLYRFPGLAFLKRYAETRNLDVAPFFAVILLFTAMYLSQKLIEGFIFTDDDLETTGRHPLFYRIFICTVGFVLLAADATIFYLSVVSTGWRGATWSLPACLATCAYLVVIVVVSLISVSLSHSIHALKRAG